MTPEQIKDFAAEAGFHPYYTEVSDFHINLVRTFAKLIEAATREECARVCRDMQNGFASDQHIECAEAIEGMK